MTLTGRPGLPRFVHRPQAAKRPPEGTNMPTAFTVQVPGAVLAGERHEIGDHWSPNVDPDAGKLPLVLLHAAVCDRRSWQRVIPTWSTTRTVVTYDQRGFGESVWDEIDGWDPVGDLLAVMDDQGIDRAVLVGNSMGGGLAQLAAILHPERVAGLLLIGPAVFGAPYPEGVDPALLAADEAIDEAEESGDLDEANRLAAAFWLDGCLATRPRADAGARELFLDMNGRALSAPPTGPIGDVPSVWDRCSEIHCPVMVLHGALDLPYLEHRARHVVGQVTDGTLTVLSDTGHLPALDAHLRTLAASAAFLERLD